MSSNEITVDGLVYGIMGQRDFENKEYDNYTYIKKVMESFSDMRRMISGGSRGVETLVEQYAKETELPYEIIRPNIRGFSDVAAFAIRNEQIVSQSDAVIVFWDGKNPHMVEVISIAMKGRKEATVVPLR